MPTRTIIVWAALGITLTSATQSRIEGLPLGIGEVLLALWMVFVASCLLRGARFAYTDAFRFLLAYWGISATLFGFGTIMALRLGEFHIATAQHDAPAFLFVACLSCLLGIRLGNLEHEEYYLLLARATFFAISLTLGLVLAIALVTPALGPVQFWYADVRFQGWATNPNQPALFVIGMPFLGWYLLRQARGFGQKLAHAVAITCAIAVGLATQSDALRVAWAGTVGGLLVWTWLRAAFRSQGNTLFISHVVVPIIVLVLAVSLGGEIVERLEQVSRSIYERGQQGEIRFRLWRNGIEAISQSPLTGLGPGAYSGKFQAFDGHEAHNSLIDWGMSTGLLGVALHVCVWLWCSWRAIRTGAPALLGVVACLAADSTFGYSLRQPVYWLLLVFVLVLTERRAGALAPKAVDAPAQWQRDHRAPPAFLVPGNTSSR